MEEIEKEEALRHYYRGKVYEITGQLDLAIEEHITAIRMGADYADIHNNLGKLYIKKEMYKEAIEEFNRALELNPAYSEARLNLEEARSLMLKPKEIKAPEVIEKPPAPAPVIKVKEIPKLDRRLLIPVAILLVSFVGFLFIRAITVEKKEIVSFALPSKNVSSFIIRAGEIWFSDWMEQAIYKCRLKDKKVEKKLKLSVYPTYIHLIGNKALLTLDNLNRTLNFHALDEYLTLGKQLRLPPIYPSSILFHDGYIYLNDTVTNRIYKLASEDLKIVDYYTPLKEKIKMVLSDGRDVFVLTDKNEIYQLDQRDLSKVVKKFILISLPAGDIKFATMTRKYIYLILEGMNNIYVLSRKHYLIS